MYHVSYHKEFMNVINTKNVQFVLTSSTSSTGEPCLRRYETISVCPPDAAQCRAILSFFRESKNG